MVAFLQYLFCGVSPQYLLLPRTMYSVHLTSELVFGYMHICPHLLKIKFARCRSWQDRMELHIKRLWCAEDLPFQVLRVESGSFSPENILFFCITVDSK